MNIFKSLSQGNGRISETNITSFLSSLLNSTIEFDNSFFLLLLELVDKNSAGTKLIELLRLTQTTIRERIQYFSKNFVVTSVPEYTIEKEGLKQILDIYVRIASRKDDTDVAFLLIENKIKISSANDHQVSYQYEYFKKRDEFDILCPVYSLLITTDFNQFSTMYLNAIESNPNSVWLKWTNKKDKNNSIESILRQLILLEQQAEIQPLNPNTLFILKSFIDYLFTDLGNSYNGTKNFSFNGFEEIESATVSLNNRIYILRRYENKMIRVFDKDENVQDIDVLPLLKQLNSHFDLQISVYHSTGRPKNTQVFGKEIIGELNKLSLKDK